MRLLYFIVCSFLFGCVSDQKKIASEPTNIALKYAEKFMLSADTIVVREPWPGAQKSLYYPINQVPERVICTSTTHLPFIEMLDKENSLIGFPGTKYISSKKIGKLVEEGSIKDIGHDGNLNIEMIIGLQPDLVFAFDMGNESSVLDKLEEAGIRVVYNADYLESSTLGRAEWIKFFGAFYHENEKADSIFDAIVTKYDSLRGLVAEVNYRPTILSGVVYGDTWFLPGGRNWSAEFFNDAGGQYFLAENNKTGWLELSFEYVFEKAREVDFWIGVATFGSKAELVNQDNRYAQLMAFKNNQVYNYNKKIGDGGGYDIFESGYARPDLVLADLIRILHPEKLPDYETIYFQVLP